VDRELRRAVEAALEARDGRPAEIAGDRPVSGGCIHDSRLVELTDGRRLFVKADASAPDDLFEREAEGLAALAAAGAIRVPRDPLPGRAGSTLFLVMEAIPTGRPGAGFWEDFGRRFAALHRATARGPEAGECRFGFDHDNYLGGTPQPNGWSGDWPDFFRRRRLLHQLDLAEQRGHATPELRRLGDRLADRLDDLLALPDEPGCLLHGDLWSGNYLAGDTGAPVLVDPAAYHGHREADLAMTSLFGGFDPRFYAAYEEAWPLPPGTAERQDVYQLYHLLNHLNLFGGGYLSSSLSILRRHAGQH
jgi:protein-ribulosamine 3-kinase